jgi:uncharacterized protein YPO0396
MPNQELDFPLADGSLPLPGFRLRRLEMLNWGTFHGKVAAFFPEDRWTLLVGENGSGKSTAVDALRTLLVPPRLLNYNDASGEQKRRDRTRRSYVRGTWATSSQEESAVAIPQNLRAPGELSILLAVFGNQHTGEVVTLVEILWELNEKIHETYAIARLDRTIREHLAELGQSRDLKKTLKQRGFDVFDSFTAYAEMFRSRLGIPSETALEVFNQAIGVKEVSDINPFVRRHMLEGADSVDFIHKSLRPHFHELDACWKAIDKAEKQIAALAPVVACRDRIAEADTKRAALDARLELAPIYYAHRHHALAEHEAGALYEKLKAARARDEELKVQRARDETERDAKLQELAADTTEQSIQRIVQQLETQNERLGTRKKQWATFSGFLKALALDQPVETADQFSHVQKTVGADRGPTDSNRDATDKKRVRFLMEQQDALRARGEIAENLEALRKHRVLIPREFVAVRAALVAATGIAVEELPFAGELIEVKPAHREWTGAIERLLHSLGVSLLVPERHYLAVADFINGRHLGIRFTFLRVPTQPPAAARHDVLSDPARVPARLNFREDHALADWLKAEIARRFHHVCCASVERLREVDFGITREGLIREGGSRHVKDDRRAVNDASNFVLGWSIEDKIKALTRDFEAAEAKAAQAAKHAADAEAQVKKLVAKLKAIDGLLAFETFTDIDLRSVQKEISRLMQEKQDLETSSGHLKTLRAQLDEVRKRLADNADESTRLNRSIGQLEDTLRKLDELIADLVEKLRPHDGFVPAEHEEAFRKLQDTGALTLDNIREVESQACGRLRRQIKQQSDARQAAIEEMLPHMSDFLRDYPEFTNDLKAEAGYAGDFVSLRDRIEGQELKEHRKRFEEFLGTNLVGDMAMFHTKLLEHEKLIKHRIESVNAALRKIAYSDTTHVQLVASATRSDEIRQFRAEVKDCLSGGINPSAEDRLRIFGRIRDLIGKFEKDDVWTRRVTDARNWLEFGVRELADADGREVNYLAGSAGKSGGQKAKLAFTILASAIAAQYGLLGGGSGREADTFRLVVIDEAFARTDEANSRRALDLFKSLGLQLVVVSPFDAKSRIVEDYVDSFHVAANPENNNSKLRRASRAEYEDARHASPASADHA